MKRDIKLISYYLRPHISLIALNLILLIVLAFLQGFGIGMLVPLMESLSGAGEHNVFTQVMMKVCKLFNMPYGFNTIIIAFACVMLLRFLTEAIQNHFNRVLTATLSEDLQKKVCDNLLDLPLSFFYKRKIGDLIATQFTSSVISGGLVDSYTALIKSVFFILVFLITGCIISWEMTSIIVSMGIVALFVVKKQYNKVQDKAYEQKIVIDRIHTYLYDTFSGIKSVKNFNNESRHREESKKLTNSYKDYSVAIMDSKVVSNLQLESFLMLTITVSLLAAVNVWNVKLVSLIIMLFICVQILPQIKNMNRCMLAIKESMPHISKVHDLINRSDKYYLPFGTEELTDFQWEIKIEHLYFRYQQNEDYVLKDINLVVKKGTIVAFVGESGAGKTTLVDLIMRYHDPEKGRVLIDGNDLKENMSVESWRRQIGSVEQNAYLFNDTVYENIRYGKYEASKEEIINAARLAYAHTFIEKLPLDYNTIVGNRGMTLSGGQQQRIALARVLLKKPAIIVLDEATSALDSESEQYIQKAIESLRNSATIFIIAHRLSTIINVDQIVFIENGKIVEMGDHNTLYKKGGRYHYFYELQFSNNAGKIDS